MNRIRILDPRVADRIAAGEVVERPASVVKELIENSLDAGARAVIVEIEAAGSGLIRVSDDGAGIDPEDAALAVRRFATSKIGVAEDLERIATYGFRGEALPSIAAVSRMTLITRPSGADAGTRVEVEGGGPPRTSAAGTAPGTVVTVESLFLNTPARRKFLKSPAREFALIVDAVQRLALAAPSVAFRVRHEQRETLAYAAGDPVERLAQVLGRDLAGAMVPLHGEGRGLTVSGWTVRPERARPGRRTEYLFVNGRPIHSRLLSRAVLAGYAELLPVGLAPVVVLMLDVDADALDVNIHPRKQEVRFSDEHRLFGAVQRAVREALLTPGAIRHVPEISTAVPDPLMGAAPDPLIAGVAEAAPLYAGSGAVVFSLAPATAEGKGRLPALRPLGQILRTYLLAEVADGLVLIDQHAAHERILYERLLGDAAKSEAAQTLTAPVPVDLSAEESGVLDEFLPASERLGFALEPFGGSTLLVRAVPAALRAQPPDRLLHRALAALLEPRNGDDAMARLAIATACHTAVRAGDLLTFDEMAALLSDLAGTEDPFTCFHGRPTMVWVSRPTLERWFLRR
ncbi:MAG TPA: DNA mismatch repair endonuclease MutL [bacterium]|nr:DNA mismatch repair endonuclease MutL [bacterium]